MIDKFIKYARESMKCDEYWWYLKKISKGMDLKKIPIKKIM
jgi:hypothetical protein